MPTTQTRVNSEVLFEFFLTFSRFEYALKASNYFKRLRSQRNDPLMPPEAIPDWDSFAASLHGYMGHISERQKPRTSASM